MDVFLLPYSMIYFYYRMAKKQGTNSATYCRTQIGKQWHSKIPVDNSGKRSDGPGKRPRRVFVIVVDTSDESWAVSWTFKWSNCSPLSDSRRQRSEYQRANSSGFIWSVIWNKQLPCQVKTSSFSVDSSDAKVKWSQHRRVMKSLK